MRWLRWTAESAVTAVSLIALLSSPSVQDFVRQHGELWYVATILLFAGCLVLAELLYRARKELQVVRSKTDAGRQDAAERTRSQVRQLMALGQEPTDVAGSAALSIARQTGGAADEPTKQLLDSLNQWKGKRAELLAAIKDAAVTLPPELRERIGEADDILKTGSAQRHFRWSELRTRTVICDHLIECLDALCRGEPLPDRSDDFANALDVARMDIESWERQGR